MRDAREESAISPWIKSGRVAACAGESGDVDVLIVGGLHGNEPEGLQAGRAVIGALSGSGEPLPGRIALVEGNRGALREKRRFLDRDLNRRWRADAISKMRERSPWERSREDREQLDLLDCFEAFLASALGEVVLIDLHTTSAGAPPFSVIIDSPKNRALARALPLPVILGFERFVDAPILTWFDCRGCACVGVEGGSSGDGESSAHLAEAVLGLLARLGWPVSGFPSQGQMPGKLYDIVHRHSVVPGSGFRMRAGFSSFQPVEQGQVLAEDRAGPIRAMVSGKIFMPLYQAQGSDGFFLLSELD